MYAPGMAAEHFEIYGKHAEYCAWPAIVRNRRGEIVVSFCSSDEHLGPQGKLLAMHSPDEGGTWQSPVVIRDSVLDDRDVGLTALRDGRILAHIRSMRHTRERYESLAPDSYEPEVLDAWIRRVERPDYAAARGLAGEWVSVSADHGRSWTEAARGPTSVHGGIELSSGEILVATPPPGAPPGKDYIGVFRTDSRLAGWQCIARVESAAVPDRHFGEPHLVELPTGRLVMMIRSTAEPYDDEHPRNVLWITYSEDGGESWAAMEPTSLWGFPPHLLLLPDGRVVCTYGHRRPPYGQRACVSPDGMTWDRAGEVVLREDAQCGDLGYPASIALRSGRILTVYYQPPAASPPPCMKPPDPCRWKPDILGTIWDLPG